MPGSKAANKKNAKSLQVVFGEEGSAHIGHISSGHSTIGYGGSIPRDLVVTLNGNPPEVVNIGSRVHNLENISSNAKLSPEEKAVLERNGIALTEDGEKIAPTLRDAKSARHANAFRVAYNVGGNAAEIGEIIGKYKGVTVERGKLIPYGLEVKLNGNPVPVKIGQRMSRITSPDTADKVSPAEAEALAQCGFSVDAKTRKIVLVESGWSATPAGTVVSSVGRSHGSSSRAGGDRGGRVPVMPAGSLNSAPQDVAQQQWDQTQTEAQAHWNVAQGLDWTEWFEAQHLAQERNAVAGPSTSAQPAYGQSVSGGPPGVAAGKIDYSQPLSLEQFEQVYNSMTFERQLYLLFNPAPSVVAGNYPTTGAPNYGPPGPSDPGAYHGRSGHGHSSGSTPGGAPGR